MTDVNPVPSFVFDDEENAEPQKPPSAGLYLGVIIRSIPHTRWHIWTSATRDDFFVYKMSYTNGINFSNTSVQTIFSRELAEDVRSLIVDRVAEIKSFVRTNHDGAIVESIIQSNKERGRE